MYNYANTNFEITENIIIKMRDEMIHRGPDDCGVYISDDKKLGFGHRRLSIIDLSSAGRQPMSSEDGNVWITYNGEVYNHQELRDALEKKRHRYKSRTDTETIIHLYEEEGISSVNKLQGMFAYALWDENRRKLYLVRDRLGVKPLYYTIKNSSLIFASEIKAILQYPDVKKDIDETALYHYLTFATTPAPFTLFKNIKKLPAGHYLSINSDGNISETQWWDVVRGTQTEFGSCELSEEEYIEKIRELLSTSIKMRMMSDVPYGVFLSGGVDSSTNVAMMSKFTDRVKTFSVGFKDNESYNELNYARQIAREFKTEHYEVLIDHQDLIEYLPELVYHQDEPIADPVCFPLYYVSKLAKDNGVSVVQIGEGSDEIFCGYEYYIRTINFYNKVWKYYENLPVLFRKILYSAGDKIFSSKVNSKKMELLRRAKNDEELFWGGAIAFTERQKKSLLSDEFKNTLGNLSSYSIIEGYLKNIQDDDFLKKLTYLELKIRLPELLLMRVDKITMSDSVEGREPYLDHRLVELAFNIPEKIKIKNQAKYILKKAVEGIIPENIIYRKKQGFSAPVKEWFLNELADYSTEVILNSKIRNRNFFNYGYIKNLIDTHKSGRTDNSFLLWNLFNLSLWYERWIEN